jgi:hypothetical protein
MSYIKVDINQLLLADVIVTTAKVDVVSTPIRKGTGGSVSHAILYTGNGNVIEAILPGVTWNTWDKAKGTSTLAIALRNPNLKTQQDRQKVLDAAFSFEHRPYDYVGALGSGVNTKRGLTIALAGIALFPLPFIEKAKTLTLEQISENANEKVADSAFFCSELVSRAFTIAGFPIVNGRASDQTPRHIRYAPGLQYVGHLLDL